MPRTTELAEHIFALSKRSWIAVSKQTAGLSETEFLSLEVLAELGRSYVGQIQKRVGVLPAQMSRLLRRLETAGFIRCQINQQDKRRIDVLITPAGRRAHATYRQAKLTPIITALERLTPEERAQFMELIQRMA